MKRGLILLNIENIPKKAIRHRFKKILICAIIFSSLSIALIFIPFPKIEIIEKFGQFGILEDVSYYVHKKYPKFSHDQAVQISLGASNGTFSLIVLNDEELVNWINDDPYIPFFQVNNVSGVYKELILNLPYYDELTVIITAESNLEVYGMISTTYLDHYIYLIFVPLIVGIILIIYLIALKLNQI